jgi:hypothetical protein
VRYSVIEKDQFTDRMNRTKARIADIGTKIGAQAADEDRRARVRSVMSRLTELSSHLQSQLNDADWSTKREIYPRPCSAHRDWANESRGCAPSTYGDERPSFGADYGDIVPSVNRPVLCQRNLSTRQAEL